MPSPRWRFCALLPLLILGSWLHAHASPTPDSPPAGPIVLQTTDLKPRGKATGGSSSWAEVLESNGPLISHPAGDGRFIAFGRFDAIRRALREEP